MRNFSLQRVLDIAIKAEEKGMQVYEKLAEKFSNKPEMAEAFSLLARDEQIHLSQFMQLKNSLEAKDISFDEVNSELLSQIGLERYFDKFASIDDNVMEILKLAYEFEKDTYLFYSAVRDVVGENEILNSIIAIEKSHMVKLFNYILSEQKFRGIADKF
jgi:rubrerythrin